MSFSKLRRAISRRNVSKADRVTASGVSSIITSTPVAISKARIFLPSLPITRPFISSLGKATTLTVDSTVCSAAHLWIARLIISLAFLATVPCNSSSCLLINTAFSAFNSSFRRLSKICFASSADKEAIFCSRSFSSAISAFSWLSFAFRASSCFLTFSCRPSVSFSFRSRSSRRRSMFSSFCASLFSEFKISWRRSFVSRSKSWRIRYKRSLDSNSASLRLSWASFWACSRICFTLASAS